VTGGGSQVNADTVITYQREGGPHMAAFISAVHRLVVSCIRLTGGDCQL